MTKARTIHVPVTAHQSAEIQRRGINAEQIARRAIHAELSGIEIDWSGRSMPLLRHVLHEIDGAISNGCCASVTDIRLDEIRDVVGK